MEASKRFGWALIASALAIGGFGMAVYVRDPATPLQPTAVSASAAGPSSLTKSSKPGALAVVHSFFDALEREDDAAMRAAFPSTSRSDRRVLDGIRKRLGDGATLAVVSEHTGRATDNMLEVYFVVIAQQPGSDDQTRLPFTATTRLENGAWKIVELR